MGDKETYEERQENEKVCLAAIYMDDFKDESKKNKVRNGSGAQNDFCLVVQF